MESWGEKEFGQEVFLAKESSSSFCWELPCRVLRAVQPGKPPGWRSAWLLMALESFFRMAGNFHLIESSEEQTQY